MTTTADILTAARQTITDPNRWTQKALARDKHNRWQNPGSPQAVCWCAEGAIELAAINLKTRPSLQQLAVTAVSKSASTLHGVDIRSLNDVTAWRPETTHQAVLNVFDHAIEQQEKTR